MCIRDRAQTPPSPRRISCTPSSFAPGSASVPVAYRQTTTPQAVGAHSLKAVSYTHLVKTPPYKATIKGATNKKGEALPLP